MKSDTRLVKNIQHTHKRTADLRCKADSLTFTAADCIVDVGPGAGIHGGEIVCVGDVEKIKQCPNSITGKYLSGERKVPVPEKRRKGNGLFLEVRGAAENNLKNINVKIPLGEFVCVTGVSGSGKSSLVNEILYKALARDLNRAKTIPGKHKEIKGMENLDKVIAIDQSPIGRTPRSNPATYTGVFTDIRMLYASHLPPFTLNENLLGVKPRIFASVVAA